MDAFRQAIMPNPSNPAILDPMDAVNVVRPPSRPSTPPPTRLTPTPQQTVSSTTIIDPTNVRDAMLWH